MKHKTILALVLAAASQVAMADDYNYLTVAYNSVEQSITLSTVQKITFSDSQVIVTTTDGQYTYALSEMEKMTFTAEPTAIESLPEESENLHLVNGRLVTAGTGVLRVYNASGALVRIANVSEGGNIDLGNLPSGLYIVNQGNQTIKIKK